MNFHQPQRGDLFLILTNQVRQSAVGATCNAILFYSLLLFCLDAKSQKKTIGNKAGHDFFRLFSGK